MSTPVAERVRQFRERQRQANPKAPFWSDLTGKLNVAATWLGLGNPAPDSFADALRAVAAKIGLKVAEEPPAAAEELPYQLEGLPEELSASFDALASQLVEQLPTRSQPKFRRNLDKFLGELKLEYQRQLKEAVVDRLLKAKARWVASTAFATTCDPDEVNRDTETTLWNFYREMQQFKKLMSAQRWRDFRQQFDDLIELIGNTCQINLPAELDKRLAAQKQAKMEDLDALLEKLNKGRISGGKDALSRVMTEEEFRLVRGLLHPDKHSPEDHQRYARAFEAFNRLALIVTRM